MDWEYVYLDRNEEQDKYKSGTNSIPKPTSYVYDDYLYNRRSCLSHFLYVQRIPISITNYINIHVRLESACVCVQVRDNMEWRSVEAKIREKNGY